MGYRGGEGGLRKGDNESHSCTCIGPPFIEYFETVFSTILSDSVYVNICIRRGEGEENQIKREDRPYSNILGPLILKFDNNNKLLLKYDDILTYLQYNSITVIFKAL